MVGQYKSKVICPDCFKESITFDPFITVTLPIPEKTLSDMNMYVLMNNNESDTIRISLTYK
jgi:ubiquitin carboxyl-terminal hydrolase 4/11/15